MINFLKNLKNKYQNNVAINTIIILIICFFQFISLDLSSVVSYDAYKIVFYWSISVISLFFMTTLLILITKKAKFSCIIISIFVLLLSITNCLVYKYHGSPFVPSDIANIKVALNSFKASMLFQSKYFLFMACFLIELFFALFFEKKHQFERRSSLALLIFCGIIVYFSYFSNPSFVPQNALSDIPEFSIANYGYFPSFIRQITLSFSEKLMNIDGYDEDDTLNFISNYSAENYFSKYTSNFIEPNAMDSSATNDYPNIIIILNESFFDLDSLIETKASKDYLSTYHNLNHSIKGYSVVAGSKGGTNLSEWEILTGNSYQLLFGFTPFNDLKMENANSVVSYLKSLGYTTIACHPQSEHNYKRKEVWTKLGFDKVYFQDDFEDLKYLGNQADKPLDESIYSNVYAWLNNKNDSPKFIFCITMQNHLPYDTSFFEAKDVVKSSSNFGKLQDEIDGYISSLNMSDNAFGNFVNRLSKYDEDVIVAMCGDHAPYFDLKYDTSNAYDYLTKIRSTPFEIWSNNQKYISNFYKIPSILQNNRFSLYYLVPSIIEGANLPISKHYSFILNMRNLLPVIPVGDYYYDSNGNLYNYDGKSNLEKIIWDFYKLEYLNITSPEKYQKYYLP